jgi:hypothetical protein
MPCRANDHRYRGVIVSSFPPIPADCAVADLCALAAAHEVPVVYVLDEYMRQHPEQAPAARVRQAQ